MPIKGFQARLAQPEEGLFLDGQGGSDVVGSWFGVFRDIPGRSGYIRTNGGLDSFRELLRDEWDQGFELVDIEYINIENEPGIWYGVIHETNSRNAVDNKNNFDSFRENVNERWNQGFKLVDVEYGNGTWVGVFQEDFERAALDYSGNLDTFTGQIRDRWGQGFELVDVEYGEGRWVGIFGDENNYGTSAYSYAPDYDTFRQQIIDNNNEGFQLVDIESGDGFWFGVYQQDSAYTNLFLKTNNLSSFESAIQEQWALGRDLADIGVGFE